MDQSPISDINMHDIDENGYKFERVYLTGDFILNEPSVLSVEINNQNYDPDDPINYERIKIPLKGSYITKVRVTVKTLYVRYPKLWNDIIERIIKNWFN